MDGLRTTLLMRTRTNRPRMKEDAQTMINESRTTMNDRMRSNPGSGMDEPRTNR